MAVRKSMEETVVVTGDLSEWITRCAKGLMYVGFQEVVTNTTLNQVTGKHRKFPTNGDILITATPSATPGSVQLVLRSTANVDNVYAAFSSPTKKIIEKAKASIS